MLRTLNVAVLFHTTISNQIFIHRAKVTRKPLDWCMLAVNVSAFICIFMVDISVVFVPLFQAFPRTLFECNLFERTGNVTHFLMYIAISTFLYCKVKSVVVILKSDLSQFAKAGFEFGSLCCAVYYIVIVSWIESFSLNDAANCFFGVPPFVGHMVVSGIISTCFKILFFF